VSASQITTRDALSSERRVFLSDNSGVSRPLSKNGDAQKHGSSSSQTYPRDWTRYQTWKKL